MSQRFYDLRDPGPADGRIDVDRVYLLEWERFDADAWRRLGGIYRSLPGAMRGAAWFGGDASSPPFLWAAVEPTGLQVTGTLDAALWSQWHEAFLRAADPLPWRDLPEGA